MRYLLTSGLVLAASAAQAETLTVMTYDSFTAEWGPGPAIEAAFEEVCGCDLVFEAYGDGGALLARLMLTGADTRADVVLGLDTNLTHAARASGLFAPHGLSPELDLPLTWDDADFIPYDWSAFAFVGNAGVDWPQSFEELAASDHTIIIEDPRSSTPGLGLVYWVKAAYGDRASEIWQGLADNIVTVTPGWDQAYAMFLEGEADLVLSYTTSPAYHIIAEGDDSKVALPFTEGHYLQIEVAGLLAASQNPDLARQFLAFLTGPEAQAVLPETNWMYPVVQPEGGPGPVWESMVKPEPALLFSPEEAADQRDEVIEEWRAALSR